jgi:hypothetical protein
MSGFGGHLAAPMLVLVLVLVLVVVLVQMRALLLPSPRGLPGSGASPPDPEATPPGPAACHASAPTHELAGINAGGYATFALA